MSQVVQLIANPRSGRHKVRRLRELAAAFERLDATVHYTECADRPPPIRENATHVCIAAGDGTVRHVAGMIARSGHPVALSIYPAGTINLLAMEVGYPSQPDEFARLVLAGEPARKHYPVALGDGYFFACAGVGPDSFAVAGVSARLKRAIGRLAYGAAFARLLFAWPRHPITLTIDDAREIACEAFYVAKGRYYAGRWSFAPSARVDEPLLHVVALRKARRRDYAHFVRTLVRGGNVAGLSNVEIVTCTRLEASADRPLPIQADGDVVGTLPVVLSVDQVPLRFC